MPQGTEFSRTEIATILAALQLYRESCYGESNLHQWITPRIWSIANWAGELTPLLDQEIEALMNRFRRDEERLR